VRILWISQSGVSAIREYTEAGEGEFRTRSYKQLNICASGVAMDSREIVRLNELAKELVAGTNIAASVRHEPRSDVLSIRVWALTDPRNLRTKECIYGSRVSALADCEQFVRSTIDDFCTSTAMPASPEPLQAVKKAEPAF
jgi:hypothetical protein